VSGLGWWVFCAGSAGRRPGFWGLVAGSQAACGWRVYVCLVFSAMKFLSFVPKKKEEEIMHLIFRIYGIRI